MTQMSLHGFFRSKLVIQRLPHITPLFLRTISSASVAIIPRPSAGDQPPPPLTQLSEDEISLQQTVKRFSNDIIRPLVREMDAKSKMDQRIIDGAFENGLMGIEVPAKYDGPESSFFNVALVVEELAKVDPSVSVLVDVQNTLVVFWSFFCFANL